MTLKEAELEQKIDNYWEREDPDDDSALEALEEMLEETEEDRRWTEHTLEALEWVLGETDVRPEIMHEAERKEYYEATRDNSKIHNQGMQDPSEGPDSSD